MAGRQVTNSWACGRGLAGNVKPGDVEDAGGPGRLACVASLQLSELGGG